MSMIAASTKKNAEVSPLIAGYCSAELASVFPALALAFYKSQHRNSLAAAFRKAEYSLPRGFSPAPSIYPWAVTGRGSPQRLVMKLLQNSREEHMRDICRTCGCTHAQAMADARTVGLLKEFQNEVYTCCQVVAWADEQWLAWVEAAEQDGKSPDDIIKPLDLMRREVY